ncbi:hypothetical protein [Phenylobacterium sp.]|uniref:hypothetical protein n=1 Tax=Phenylobacterium sp. TaxID=1871053 RepID=UPI00391D4AD2
MKRYVMANRADGVADVMSEDDIEPGFKENRIRELWLNTETPEGGAVFRMLVFPPSRTRPRSRPSR